jgi:hypothetical protein
MHGALAVDDVKRLIGIVAMHLVFVAGFVVMHPGVKARGVKDFLSPFLLVGEIDHVDDFDGHCGFLR